MAPCSDSMIQGVLTLKPETSVAEALAIFEEHDIRSIPVVDDTGKLVGLFGLKHLLLGLLPASATMEDGLRRLDFVIGAAPGIAKRLKKVKQKAIGDIMDKNPMVLYQDTATWEALRVMAVHGSPISIVEEKTGNFVGMISRKSLLTSLDKLLQNLEEESDEEDVA